MVAEAICNGCGGDIRDMNDPEDVGFYARDFKGMEIDLCRQCYEETFPKGFKQVIRGRDKEWDIKIGQPLTWEQEERLRQHDEAIESACAAAERI